MVDQQLYDKIMSRCKLEPGPLDTPCMVWQRATASGGYGVKWDKERMQYVHRLTYEFVHGPIEHGLLVLHECDRPACCNPKHLKAGTQKQNLADAVKRKRMNPQQGETNHYAKLTKEQVQEIRSMYETGQYFQHEIAKRFGISRSHVGTIVTRLQWKHV